MKRLACMLLIVLTQVAWGSADLYPLDTPEQVTRFEHLTQEVRCVTCQNQSVADSAAPVAQDVKRFIYQQVQAYQSDQDIRQALSARYGDSILYRPPVNRMTYGLWGAPIIIGALALFFLLTQCLRRPS